MFAVVVTLAVRPEHFQDFLPLMLENATLSKQNEPGCVQFDVCTDPERASEVFLYETYIDAAAFQSHLQTDHFKRFDAAVDHMVLAKDVRLFSKVIQ